ncbi:hypothetical protein OG21DRAFT_1166345 [Imleria badia]|nr:hypothetical protein OG21DRAFT_1166345 [Imleria badia]
MGKILLTRHACGQGMVGNRQAVQSVIWLPTGDAFLSVEGSEIVKLDLYGKVLDTTSDKSSCPKWP